MVTTKKRQKSVVKTFTMPIDDYDALLAIKKRCLRAGIDTNKSEILRAGIKALSQMKSKELVLHMQKIPKSIAGRPKQDGDDS